MADEKSTAQINKMIHKKTGASFSVVYVTYVSLVYTTAKKYVMFTPPRYPGEISSLQLLEGN